jgi:hypothetical protein
MQKARTTGQMRHSELHEVISMRANERQIMLTIKHGGGGGSQIKHPR